jgi:hypothetical protein
MGFRMVQTEGDHGWLDNATTPKPAPMPKRHRGGKPGQKLTVPDDAELNSIAHATCVDHVKVAGLHNRVCIRRGDDVDAVVAEARELAGLAR